MGRRFLCFFGILSCLIPIVSNCFGQWVQTNGPYASGSVVSIAAATDSILYIIVDGIGLYRSNDNGESFAFVPGAPQPNYGVISSAVGRYGWLFVSDSAGTYRSTDEGNSWARVLPVDFTRASQMMADSEGNVFAGSRSNGSLFRSTDDGNTWTKLNLGAREYSSISALGKNFNGDIFAGEMTSVGLVLRSIDKGDSWDTTLHLSSYLTITQFAFAPGGHVIAVFRSNDSAGVFLSSDNGATWKSKVLTTSYVTWTSLPIVYDGASGSILAAVVESDQESHDNIFRSSDFGNTWTFVSQIRYSDPRPFVTDNRGRIYIGGGDGLKSSMDVGQSWNSPASVFCAPGVRYLTLMPGGRISVQTSSSTYRLSDSGNSWVSGGRAGSFVLGRTGNYFLCNGSVYKSTDGGNVWSNIFNPGANAFAVWELAQLTNGYLFTGGLFYYGIPSEEPSEIWRSTNDGSSWDRVYSRLHAGTINTVDATSNNIILACDGAHGIVRSTDFGATWNAANTGLPANLGINVIRNSNGYVYVGTSGGIFRSTDGGVSWNSASDGLNSNDVRSIVFNTVGTVFAGTANGVYLSTDYGAHWISRSEGLIDLNVLSLLCDSLNYLFAGTQSAGVFKSDIPTAATEEHQKQLPGRFALFQNYPNPFNPNTNIHFELPRETHVRLELYNLLGQHVLQVLDERRPAGVYDVKVNSGNLSSGVYFYRIVAGEFVQTKRMVLMK